MMRAARSNSKVYAEPESLAHRRWTLVRGVTMVQFRHFAECALSVALTFVLSSSVWAQQASSGIAGVVTDASGAVLPGVTVEASSPALIEKVRSVTTGSDGRYNVIDLRPGTYSVTFTLSGFQTFKREGIVLTAGFTASVN